MVDKQMMMRRILDFLRPDMRYNFTALPRPFVVEFDGMPSCGKTTVIKEVDTYFRRNDFRVFTPQEGAQVVRHIPRNTPEYNIRTALYIIHVLMDVSWGHTYDLVLLDRGIFNSLVWLDYWHEKNLLDNEQKDLLTRFYLLPFFTKKIDCAILMSCDPDVACTRENQIETCGRNGRFTNPDTLRTLQKRYLTMYEKCASQHPQLITLDTTHVTKHEMVQCAIGLITHALYAKTKTA